VDYRFELKLQALLTSCPIRLP